MCDETNNTGEVIDRNEFVAEIFIKPQEVSTLSHYLSLQPELAFLLKKSLRVIVEENKKWQTLTTSKPKLAGGGARPNQFKVTMPFPGYAQVGGEIEDLAFLCTATSIPAMTIGNVNVPFRGRQIKIAGDRTFADWSITFLMIQTLN